MKKLTSERLGREGLAAWGVGVAASHEDLDSPEIEEKEEMFGEISLVVTPSEGRIAELSEKTPEQEEEPPPQQGCPLIDRKILN